MTGREETRMDENNHKGINLCLQLMKAPTAVVSPVVIFYGGVVLEGFLQEFKLLNWL